MAKQSGFGGLDDPDVAKASVPATATEEKPKDTKVSEGDKVCNTGKYALTDPLTQQRFEPNQEVKVEKMSGWIQSQVDAGIFKKC